MKFTSGTVFSIKRDCTPEAGCTTSEAVSRTADLSVSVFSLAAHTDISAESYAYPKLLLVVAGEAESYESGGRMWTLAFTGDVLGVPALRLRASAPRGALDDRKGRAGHAALQC